MRRSHGFRENDAPRPANTRKRASSVLSPQGGVAILAEKPVYTETLIARQFRRL